MRRHQPFDASYAENIISFGTYYTAMTQPNLAQMRAYWEELRAGRLMPLRSEVDPREMSPFLETCFVLEHQSPGNIRFRLAGMGINDLMGMEVRGMPLRALIAPEARAAFSAQVEALFRDAEIHEYKLMSQQPNTPDLSANMLLLPLKGDEGQTDRAIGCMSIKGAVGAPPRRFRVTELLRTSLETGLCRADDLQHPQLEPAGFSETAAPYQSEPGTMATGVPYLRVVK